MSKVIVVSGTSSGFGAMTVRALADAGHTVYAGMRDVDGRNADAAQQARDYPAANGGTIRPIDLDVSEQDQVDKAVAEILDEQGRIEVLVHNAGHMVLGPAGRSPSSSSRRPTTRTSCPPSGSTAPSSRRCATAATGLLVWVGSTSSRGGTPPYLGPYFAAKAAEDALAVTYAAELARFGIDTVIVVPGSFTKGTNHFAHAGSPTDEATASAFNQHYAGLMDVVSRKLAELADHDADPTRSRSKSRASSTCPKASGRSRCTSTPPTTAQRPSTR